RAFLPGARGRGAGAADAPARSNPVPPGGRLSGGRPGLSGGRPVHARGSSAQEGRAPGSRDEALPADAPRLRDEDACARARALSAEVQDAWGTVELGAYLRALGMPLAFTRLQANFSGINGHEPPHEDSLFISGVLHKALV